jgi:FKBP-type peptidyl-prolyl cis-trans isomerase FkpA
MVPPNKTILYRLHLINVIRTGTEQVQYEKDTAAIHTYIKTKNIQNVYMDASGMWYSLEAEGPGKTPRPYDLVSFSYKGSLMSNGSIFDQGSVVSQNIFSLVDGLKFGIPHTNEGSSVTFYIPSGLAYGPNGSSPGIPGNANVIFEIKLNTVDN